MKKTKSNICPRKKLTTLDVFLNKIFDLCTYVHTHVCMYVPTIKWMNIGKVRASLREVSTCMKSFDPIFFIPLFTYVSQNWKCESFHPGIFNYIGLFDFTSNKKFSRDKIKSIYGKVIARSPEARGRFLKKLELRRGSKFELSSIFKNIFNNGTT
jgi:hypothetical protein